ncbi:LacI family DNA-binding transcriptional regulator [Clostridium sp. KNHs216]|uniref:LacI family DNA-binding transcriptional regulator n=1 Tax=Clostridium sp. KNHs216 TaxID=1550235 RepID=UPI00114F14F4|nr:LacI family DNA-binding transcriptional regulator [Clostridium sp. KNHs216]TQI66439.1 LacI family transcriptional regulator [Clostridium sp. KNHs216]
MSTIRDVAKYADVSIATVSRILSGDANYKATEKTRKRVKDAAVALNYSYKRRVPKVQAKNICCILSMTAEKYADPYFSSILSALESRLLEHNCIITTVRNYSELSDPQKLDLTLGRDLDGLVIMDDLPEDAFRYVCSRVRYVVGCDTAYGNLDNIGFDLFNASVQAVRHLIDRGYRKIAYVGGANLKDFRSDKRQIAIRSTLELAGLEYRPEWMLDCKWDIGVCLNDVRGLLSLPAEDRPDAIFVGNDTLASAVLPLIKEMGLTVPQDVAVIGFNNDSISSYTFPGLTTVSVPVQEMGKTTADVLYSRICGDAGMVRNIVFPTELVIRSST